MHLIVEREKKKGVISLFSSIPALPAPPPALKSPAIVVHAFSQGQTGKKESANMHFFLSTTAVGGKKKKKARAKKLAETEKKKKLDDVRATAWSKIISLFFLQSPPYTSVEKPRVPQQLRRGGPLPRVPAEHPAEQPHGGDRDRRRSLGRGSGRRRRRRRRRSGGRSSARGRGGGGRRRGEGGRKRRREELLRSPGGQGRGDRGVGTSGREDRHRRVLVLVVVVAVEVVLPVAKAFLPLLLLLLGGRRGAAADADAGPSSAFSSPSSSSTSTTSSSSSSRRPQAQLHQPSHVQGRVEARKLLILLPLMQRRVVVALAAVALAAAAVSALAARAPALSPCLPPGRLLPEPHGQRRRGPRPGAQRVRVARQQLGE